MDSKNTKSRVVLQLYAAFRFTIARLRIVPILLMSVVGLGLATAEFDVSYSLIQNGGAENGLSGWLNQGDVSIENAGPQGSLCFKLAASDTVGVLKTQRLSVRRSEQLQLSYRLKADSSAQAGSAFAMVRCWDADRETMLSQTRFPLNATGGQWTKQIHTVTTDAGAYFVDVQFILTAPASSSASVFVDDISLFREIKYNPLYADIKPLSENDTLYVFTKGPAAEDNQFVAIQTLQGIVARTDRPRLWIDAGDNTFVRDLEQRYAIRFDRSMARDFGGLLETLKPYTSGSYVLYSMRDRPSLSAAATLAGLLDAVAIDTALESTAVARGYTKAIDVRGKDCRWVYDTYRRELNDDLIIVHTNDPRVHRSAYHLKDWAAATKALSWWYDDEAVSRSVFRSMAPCSPVYGWLNPITGHDEGLSVRLHSEEGLFQLPSDWMINLSVHASMGHALKDMTFKQVAPRQTPVNEKGVHYVTFIMSDMDNILTEIGTNSF